ncbi:hypothetical protein IR150_16980 [Providencia alcalifaciens]|uniref:hypothetical protein n=1 Tax=Providencia alcalifaciens TaxID=126385 RepID=UPI0015D0B4FC|nr:hypothetical protein [Providencia alcalifaciens]MBF0693164.1 hypothetical protein [Providencia alcalifaciens]NYS91668.1 hypothetical protein [Providencia alcalifaciens]
MKRHQKIRHSRLFQVNPHGFLFESPAVNTILADINRCFPSMTQLIWSSYRADNEIHDLVMIHDQGQFVLTMESGLGPTEFTAITDEDLCLCHKQVELVDSIDIFHFVRMLIEYYQFQSIHLDNHSIVYSS